MELKDLSVCFFTNKVNECSLFYQEYFSGKVTFDCGWYINLTIGNSKKTLQFMEPQGEGPLFSGEGIMLNFNVEDVDAEYNRLTSAGLKVVMPLEDHPWGDRGFSIMDPVDNSIYIYSDRTPSSEFSQYYR